MNKKLNTFIFLILGTIVNIVVMLLLLVIFLYLIGFLFSETNGSVITAVTLTAVMLSVVGSYLIYSRIVKLINKKWNLEQWIEPLFNKKK